MMIILAHIAGLVLVALVAFSLYLFAYSKGWNAAVHYYSTITPLNPDSLEDL